MSEPPPSDPSPGDPAAAPAPKAVHDYLLYALSLPERALRSTVGVAGGAVRESAGLLMQRAPVDYFLDLGGYTGDCALEALGNGVLHWGWFWWPFCRANV